MAVARYFYGLNTYSTILLKKCKILELFLNLFASGCNISMIIYDLSKYNCQMFYHKNYGIKTYIFIKLLRCRYLDRRSIKQAPDIYLKGTYSFAIHIHDTSRKFVWISYLAGKSFNSLWELKGTVKFFYYLPPDFLAKAYPFILFLANF